MKISYNWLKQYLDSDIQPESILDALPLLGFDIEETETLGPPQMEHVVVGQVIEYEAHPNADRLRLCNVKTDESEQIHSIICGAKNFKEGDKVMVALPGAVLPGNFKIKKSKLRGIESQGMLCSAKELNIGQDHEGIMIIEASVPLGTPINQCYSDSDIIFNLEITPNRVDVLSHIGVARELLARFGGSLQVPELKTKLKTSHTLKPNASLKSLELKNTELCSEYSAVCIENVAIQKSPQWLIQSLEAVGLRPVNNVVDITNYVLHESGQPLHAFDSSKLENNSIQVRHAQKGEAIKTLDGKDYKLNESILVVADAQKPIAIAGVMGGANTEVDENSQSIVLEAAYFDPSSIRRTARGLGISTDSSYRFERGVDAAGIEYAIQRATDLILEYAGGSVAGPKTRLGSALTDPKIIDFSPDLMRDFIGFSVSDAEVEAAFVSLNCSVEKTQSAQPAWRVQVPSYRNDLKRAVDLYEEFIRIFGTDKIPSVEISANGISPVDHPIYTFNDTVSHYLTGQSFNEAFLYTLRDVKEYEFLLGEAHSDTAHLRLNNPLQSDQSHLRNSLIPGLLDVLELNHARQNSVNKFYERGRVFKSEEGSVTELVSVGFVSFAKGLNRQWLEREAFDFYKSKALAENIIQLLPVASNDLDFSPIEQSALWQPLHSASAGSIKKEGYQVSVGLLNIKHLKEKWNLSEPVFAGSILIHPDLFNKKAEVFRYSAISNQPASSKDLSLIVDKSVLSSEVHAAIVRFAQSATEGFICESVHVFDVYEGEGLDADKKSFTISMSFRAQDRTLKDAEVNKAFEKIQESVNQETNYQIRK
jgi:phenylalanyl-tRNA synthetase beta chain